MSSRSPHPAKALGLIVGVALTVGVAPPSARACGGFFCNQPAGPNDLPVAQTAENVLFAMERAPSGQYQLEAHVQIFYTGPADRFSWVVPVDSAPTLGVGSNLVFSALLGATAPRFELQWREEGVCRPGSPAPPAASLPAPGGAAADAGAPGRPGVSVSFRGNVGPYDAAVLRSTDRSDAGPLLEWLNVNGYFVSAEATRLIQEYVRDDKHFVAIRLQSDREVSEIEPLVMRFLGPGPCVPLKLTSIAAIRDLRVNLWVLAESRVVPDNYFEMEINLARIDWFRGGANYEELVKSAADQAGGNAFVTEFVGPAAILKDRVLPPGRYQLDPIRNSQTPPEALANIGAQGFPRDSTLIQVLRVHIPMPDVVKAMGVDERTFYNNLAIYWNQHRDRFAPFDARALAADLEARYVTPLQKAQALFDRHPKLTRLATFISPEEMKVDPTFVLNPDLPDVPALRTATATLACGDRQHTRCTAPVRLEAPGTEPIWLLPKPQQYCYGQADAYERAQLDAMPALHRAWARTTVGEGVARVDHQGTIRTAIQGHNAVAGSPRFPTRGTPTVGFPDPLSGPTVSPEASYGGGCSCRLASPGAGLPALALPLAAGLLGLIGRRRKRT
jgi:hypothetical protein